MTRAMKDSGIEWIGQIPENWKILKFKNIGTYINGYAFKPEDWTSEGKAIIRIQDLTGSNNKPNYYDKQLDIKYNVSNGDFLISWAATLDAFIWNKKDAWLNQHIFKAIPNRIMHNKYFFWLIKEAMQNMNNDNKHGIMMQHVTLNVFNNFLVPIPPLPDQQKIADYLDKRCEKIDTAIDNQKQIIEKLKEYKQSLITETVTKGLNPNVKLKDSGIEWIGSIPEHWEIKKLKYLFKIKKNIAGKEGFDILSVTQSGIKIKDISTNEGQIAQDYSKYQIVNIDDFIMNHMDLLTGFVDCSHFNGVTSPDYRVFCQIEPTTNSNLYYNYIFQQCYKNKIFYGLGQGVSGLGRWRLPSDMFLNFTLPQPPLSEQKEIVEYLDKKCNQIDEAIKQKEETISKLEEYKKSLIFECVTGKKEVS